MTAKLLSVCIPARNEIGDTIGMVKVLKVEWQKKGRDEL